MIKHLYNKYLVLLCICQALAGVASGQVSISFNPPAYGQQLEGLTFVQIGNTTGQTLTATVTVKVREASAGNVVTIIMPSVIIRQGMNFLDRNSFSKARFSFGNNSFGSMLNQSGKFMEGEYEYCFEIEIDSKNNLANLFFENCFLHKLQPLTPLLLINPVDGDEACNTKPDFLWQPPLPLPPNARFRLVVTELKDKQNPAEAINVNYPIINESNIPFNQLRFPANAPSLMNGKSYAWQVIVYVDKVIINRSEIWTYNVKCEEETPQISGDSYREVKEQQETGFYIADKVLRFSFTNPYSAGMLSYSIVNLKAPGENIKRLPALTLSPGLNKYDVDLTENKAFKTDQEYRLVIYLTNGRECRLNFIYKNE